MLQSLHSRERADNFKNDVRSGHKKGSIGKWIYVSLIGALVLWIANLFIGPMLWFQADGLVSADHRILAAAYQSEVVELRVREGEYVEEGDVIAILHSPSVVETISRLTSNNAEIMARQTDLVTQIEVAEAIEGYVEERANVAEAAVARMRQVADRDLVTNTGWNDAMRERFEAHAELAAAEARMTAGRTQLDRLNEAQREARTALEDLRARYNDGIVRAPADGIVGTALTREGIVLEVGHYVADLYVGEPYVLAYLETGTLYDVEPGETVIVADGFNQTAGEVVEVQPIADQLPPEFQRIFQPRARARIVKIALGDPDVFPLLSTVSVHEDLLGKVIGWASDMNAYIAEIGNMAQGFWNDARS